MTRSIRLDAVLVQAVIAGALSFSHLHDLADAAGQTGWKAWAYPISVDLLLVAVFRRLRNDRSRSAWFWFLIALAASLGANIATAGLLDLHHVPAWLRILVAGWPALAFLGGTLLAHHAPTAKTTEPAPAAPETALEEPVRVELDRDPASAPPAVEPTPEPERPAVEPAPEPAPTPDPTPAPTPAPPVPVPAALVEHARKIAAAHRARTGSAIDNDTLRVRLGVPAPLADSIAAQLT